MHIKFRQTITLKKDGVSISSYQKGRVYDVPADKAESYIAKGYAEKFVINIPKGEQREKASQFFKQLTKEKEEIKREGERKLADLLQALKLKPEPSDRLTTTTITDKEIEDFKRYFATKTDITADKLASMILAIYTYSKDIKDNKTLSKVSTDLLTLYRLTKFYDKNRNGK